MTRESLNKGVQLKFARVYREYSQKQLCDEVEGLSQSNLSMFERGFENVIKVELIEGIMRVLNFPIKFLDKNTRVHNSSFDFH